MPCGLVTRTLEIGEYRIRLSNHIQAGIEKLETSPAPSFETTDRESMDLGSVQVYLGEAKSETLTKLAAAGYTANGINEDRNRVAVYRGSLLANLSFSDDRVIFINKNWDPEESSGYEVAKAIYFASQSLNARGCRSVKLSTSRTLKNCAPTRFGPLGS